MKALRFLGVPLAGLARCGTAALGFLLVPARRFSKSHQQRSVTRLLATTTVSAGGGTPEPLEAYAKLKKELQDAAALSEIEGILSYDEQVFMPAGAASARATQKAVLAGVVHARRTGPDMRAAVEAVRPHLDGVFEDEAVAANVRLAVEAFDKESRKSQELAEREARLESEAFGAWRDAKRENDWALFAPKLRDMFELKQEVARVTRPHLCEPYDGALDAFERGTTAKRVDDVFAATKAELRPLLDAVLEKKRQDPKIDAVHDALRFDHPGFADLEAQRGLASTVARSLGYDFERGRLDASAHPFTGGAGPSDTRITTRYLADNWLEGFAATVHEVGHALYEQGRPQDGDDVARLPASEAMTMGVHESQSLLWERCVMQSRAFWDFAAPLFYDAFPHTKAATPDDFYRAVNVVTPSKIRVQADELTYPFHVFLRYDLERRLFAGDMAVDDIPAAWELAMRDALGVEVEGGEADGALQDIHWAFGAVGYFPSYTLGAIAAAQIFAAAQAAIPDLDANIAAGNFAPLLAWLRDRVHRRGSIPDSPDALLTAATGSPLTPEPFLAYLRTKYADLYRLETS